MAKQTSDFAKLIQEDREQRQQQQWQGTFLEYLELVKADPSLAKSSHRRIHDMIVDAGVSELNPENDPQIQRLYGDEPNNGKGYMGSSRKSSLAWSARSTRSCAISIPRRWAARNAARCST
jgi:predicted Ser/Thr protein kinase